MAVQVPVALGSDVTATHMSKSDGIAGSRLRLTPAQAVQIRGELAYATSHTLFLPSPCPPAFKASQSFFFPFLSLFFKLI